MAFDPLSDTDGTFDDVNLLGPSVIPNAMESEFTASSFLDNSASGMMDDNTSAARKGSAMMSANGSLPTLNRNVAPMLSGEEEQNAVKSKGWWRLCGFLTVDYYMPYFNVSTEDVSNRLKCVAMPWKGNFFQVVDGRPDLYGPFWVCTTLVFLIAATSNLASWMRTDSGAGEQFQHDFKVFSVGLGSVFGFAIAMPIVAWASFHYLGVSTADVTFMELTCVYGYSIFAFMFACVLCTVPNENIHWAALFISFLFSASFLVHNVWQRLGVNPSSGDYLPPMNSEETEDEGNQFESPKDSRKLAALLLLGMLGLHGIFALVLKFEFFVA